MIVFCTECGAEVKKPPSHIKRARLYFCNSVCKSLHQKKYASVREAERAGRKRRWDKMMADPALREKHLKYFRDYFQQEIKGNPDRYKRYQVYSTRYRNAHPEKIRALTRKRYAAQKARMMVDPVYKEKILAEHRIYSRNYKRRKRAMIQSQRESSKGKGERHSESDL